MCNAKLRSKRQQQIWNMFACFEHVLFLIFE
uniref:Uncharacterized protein n=1 Tax=Arundo donax TaxID=35708 RepID=A0A0A8YXX8_ARUDO